MHDERTWPFTVAKGAEPKLSIRKVRLEVVRGPDQGLIVDVAGTEARIGSGKTCDLVLRDPTVSRMHLLVRVDGDAIRVTDAGSRNGTLLDNIRIADAWARPDSTIAIGATTLRLRMSPGNVRELRNAVARAISIGALSPGEPPGPAATTQPVSQARTGEESMTIDLSEQLFVGRERVAEAFERKYLAAALKQTGGNVSRAAELSGVNRKFIQRAMKRWGSL